MHSLNEQLQYVMPLVLNFLSCWSCCMRIAHAAVHTVDIPKQLLASKHWCIFAKMLNSCRPSCLTTVITICLQHRIPPACCCHEYKSAFQLDVQLCIITLRQLVSIDLQKQFTKPKSFLATQKDRDTRSAWPYTTIGQMISDKRSSGQDEQNKVNTFTHVHWLVR